MSGTRDMGRQPPEVPDQAPGEAIDRLFAGAADPVPVPPPAAPADEETDDA